MSIKKTKKRIIAKNKSKKYQNRSRALRTNENIPIQIKQQNNTVNPTKYIYKDPILREVQEDPSFFAKIGQVVKKGGLDIIENIEKYIGIGLKYPDPEGLKKTLQEELQTIKKALENTGTLEELAIIGALALKAVSPFMDELKKQMIYRSESTGTEIGQAIVRVTLNILQEIPVIGVVIAIVRSFNTILTTYLNIVQKGSIAANEYINTSQSIVEEFKKLKNEYLRLKKEKMSTLQRTQNSIEKFKNPA